MFVFFLIASFPDRCLLVHFRTFRNFGQSFLILFMLSYVQSAITLNIHALRIHFIDGHSADDMFSWYKYLIVN